MIIGILQCDSVRPEFRHQFENYPEMLQTLFTKVDATLTFKIYDVQHGKYPNRPDECNGYVTTGSKASVYDKTPWIDRLQKFIIELNIHNIKLIAICFGHQLVAQAFGGKAENSNKGWGVGVHTSQIHKSLPWMSPVLQNFNVLVSHQDQVTKLPADATLIASNEFCANGMFQLGNNMLAMQGHPEFNKQYAETLMRFRGNRVGKNRLNEGITSLQKKTDELIIAKWMLQFLSDE